MSDILEGKWNQVKGSAKQAWGKLTDDDLKEVEGRFDKLVGKLQERYGWEKAEAESKARDWMKDK